MGSSASWMSPHAARTRPPHPPGGRARHSRLLRALLGWASRPSLAVLLIAADALWIAVSVASGFPDRPEAVFHTLVDAVTLALVFVVQHSAAREQAATQRKLDEILHALPDAADSLIALEEGSDEELRRAALRHHHARRRATPPTALRRTVTAATPEAPPARFATPSRQRSRRP